MKNAPVAVKYSKVAINRGMQTDLDTAMAQKDVAAATLTAAEESLSLAVEGPRQEDIDAAKAMLEAYQAELAIARRNLTDANLICTEAGVIQNRILEPGDMASPQTPAYILALTNRLGRYDSGFADASAPARPS